MKKFPIILAVCFFLLLASPALALDMEYYTYGGFNPITQAFTKIALIFSDSGYQGLLFVVTALGLLAGAAAWIARAATGAKVIPLVWAVPVLFGAVMYLALFVPKGNITVYDPVVKVGGLLHFMLPESGLDPSKAKERPFMFGDTGIPLLFKKSYELGAQKQRLQVKVAGGSQILDDKGYFNIGKRNYAIVRKLFWRNNILIENEDVGGNVNRTMSLNLSDGSVHLKVSGRAEKIL